MNTERIQHENDKQPVLGLTCCELTMISLLSASVFILMVLTPVWTHDTQYLVSEAYYKQYSEIQYSYNLLVLYVASMMRICPSSCLTFWNSLLCLLGLHVLLADSQIYYYSHMYNIQDLYKYQIFHNNLLNPHFTSSVCVNQLVVV